MPQYYCMILYACIFQLRLCYCMILYACIFQLRLCYCMILYACIFRLRLCCHEFRFYNVGPRIGSVKTAPWIAGKRRSKSRAAGKPCAAISVKPFSWRQFLFVDVQNVERQNVTNAQAHKNPEPAFCKPDPALHTLHNGTKQKNRLCLTNLTLYYLATI
jgi:hypothetical protein